MIQNLVIELIYEQICSKLDNKYFKYSTQDWVMTLDKVTTKNICLTDLYLSKPLNKLPFIVTMYNKGYGVNSFCKKEIILLEDIDLNWNECSEEIFNKIKSEVENLLK